MRALLSDLRFALRKMRTARLYSLTVILVLALGIGANTAVFTLVHAVLLKSLPVAKPEQLFRLGDAERCCVNGGMEGSWSLFPYDLYRQVRDHTPAFEQLAAFEAGQQTIGLRLLNRTNAAESRSSEFVSGNYFQMFGLNANAGRLFTPDDDQPAAPPVAVMSYRAWHDKYGGDDGMIGAPVAINGQPFTLIGIAPPGFFGDGLRTNPPEIWIPLQLEPYLYGPNSIMKSDPEWLDIIGRLPVHATPSVVEAQLTTELRQWLYRPERGLPEDDRKEIAKQIIRLTPGGGGLRAMREEYQDSLKLLLLVTGFVLLIACANLANLLLARMTSRYQEVSIRAAMGASRARLIRQAFSETVLLSVFGGAAGIAIAVYGTKLILHVAFPHRYVPIETSPSWPVLGFAFALAVMTGFLFGLAPVWLMSRTQPIDALRASSRATDARSHWAQRSLVVLQAALSLALLCAAGLVVQSLRNMRNEHFGFETQNRYLVEFDPETAGYKPEQLDRLYRQIREGLEQIPGLKSATYAQYTPMGGSNWESQVNIEGRPPDANDDSVHVRVGPDYFSAIGTRILEGRPITDQDTPASRPVALVNQEFVKRYFDGKNPLGRHLGQGGSKHAGDLEIVGVTENTNYWWPGEPVRPMFFYAATQVIKDDTADVMANDYRSMYMSNIILQTPGAMPDLEKQVRRVLAQINPDLPVIDFFPFAQQVESNLDQQQMIADLMTIFGVLALLLATVGLYGVTAYGVERRTNEIGVRMALGADRGAVLRMVMRTVTLQFVAGLIVGFPLILLSGRLLASKLFGIQTFNLSVFAVATLALAFSALVAGFLPARRAALIEPMGALRAE